MRADCGIDARVRAGESKQVNCLLQTIRERVERRMQCRGAKTNVVHTEARRGPPSCHEARRTVTQRPDADGTVGSALLDAP